MISMSAAISKNNVAISTPIISC